MENELYIIQNGQLPNAQWYAGQQNVNGKDTAFFTDIPGFIKQFVSKEEAEKCFKEKIQKNHTAFVKMPSKSMSIKKWLDFVHEYML